MLDRYDVGFIDWYSKYPDSIKIELTLIDHIRGLVKPPSPISAAFRPVSDRRWNTSAIPKEHTWINVLTALQGIKTHSGGNKWLLWGNRHQDLGNFHPILEAGYLMMKDEEGGGQENRKHSHRLPESKRRHIIFSRGQQESSSVLSVCHINTLQRVHRGSIGRIVGIIRPDILHEVSKRKHIQR